MIDTFQFLFSVLIQNNIYLSPEKCYFHTNLINFLGLNIKNRTISPIESNIKKVTAFPVPKTKKQVKSFLGLPSFYRNLIPSFAEIAALLVHFTSKKN